MSRSSDGGRTWTHMTTELGGAHVNTLAVDPRSPQTVYAGAGGGGAGPGPLAEGLFKTKDGGRSWHRVGLAHQTVIALGIDSRRPWIVYAASAEQGVHKSVDAGRTWRRASAGLGGCRPSALVLDPIRPHTLYAGALSVPSGKECGVFRSTDGARSWGAFSDGLTDRGVTRLAVSSDGRTLYAGTQRGGVAATSLPLVSP